MKELQPINQNVLIELDEKKEHKSIAGILLPEAEDKKAIGKVIAISNIEKPEIGVGDMVLYKEYSGSKVEIENKKYLLIQYADILAKVVETESI